MVYVGSLSRGKFNCSTERFLQRYVGGKRQCGVGFEGAKYALRDCRFQEEDEDI